MSSANFPRVVLSEAKPRSFDADGEVRGVGVSVNGSQGSYASHFVTAPRSPAIERPFEQQPQTVLRPVGLADATGDG